MSRTTVILGGGQLAFDLQGAWSRRRPEDTLVALGHADADVADLGSLRAALASHTPRLVVNTAAYNRVDQAEVEVAAAFAVNATGPGNVALACREVEAVLVHVSTDYVFSGRSRRPHVEGDPVDPVNVYGASKAAGEMLVRCLLPRHFVVRSSGLYGVAGSSGKGGNFVETMLALARAGREIRVVDDQVLTPTPTAPSRTSSPCWPARRPTARTTPPARASARGTTSRQRSSGARAWTRRCGGRARPSSERKRAGPPTPCSRTRT